METKAIAVQFTCEYQTHNLEEFQKGGHTVPGMVDEEQRRREFEGDTVHVLELKYLGGQVVRVLGDSVEEVERLMALRVPEVLFAYFAAQRQTEFSYDQMKRLVDGAGKMQVFMDERFGKGGNFADCFDAAIHHMTALTQKRGSE